jgi:hypothetical protein
MRLILTILFLFISIRLLAPDAKILYIQKLDPLKSIDKILLAFELTESNMNETVINSLGYAGILQEGQQIIDDANRINELNGNPYRFELSDRLNQRKAVWIWYTIQNHYNPSYRINRACDLWNSLGGEVYYKRVLSEFNKL